MQDIINYCFKRKNSWYFNKRINKQYTKKNKDIYFKISLKKLLGNQFYYKVILQGSLFSITNYLNNHLEIFLFNRENITLEELTEFTIELINRYEKEAINLNNDYANQLNKRIKEIEDMRFNALDYVDDNGRIWGGHTPTALDKEIDILKEAYDSKNRKLLSQKAKDILNRQNIITKNEITKLDFLELNEKVDFEEALVKKEIEILLQDKTNYLTKFGNKPLIEENKVDEAKIIELFSSVPEFKVLVDSLKLKNEKNSDNWDYLIESFLHESSGSSGLRGEDVALEQFKQMMKGDNEFYVEVKGKTHYLSEKTILNATVDDIKAVKQLLIDIPNLTKTKDFPFLGKWRERGIIYTIFQAKKLKAPKNKLSGIQSKCKVIINFLKYIKIFDKKYNDLNIEMWDKFLSIGQKDLSYEDIAYNEDEELTPLQSEYINGFLLNRYKDNENMRAGTSMRNFTRHTNGSPHIFWSILLGIYTGARAEELAQLRLRDIQRKEIDGEFVYFIDFCITDHKKQSIKNLSSVRKTPIHNDLINMGFLNYVQERKRIKADYLFDLKINKDGKRKEFQKSFNNDIKVYLKEAYPDLTNYRFSFHGLRSHFVAKYIKSHIVKDIEEMEENANINQLIELKKMIGHTAKKFHKDTTIGTYFKEDLEFLNAKKKINEINFGITEGFEEIKKLYIGKYGEPIVDLEL